MHTMQMYDHFVVPAAEWGRWGPLTLKIDRATERFLKFDRRH